MKKYTVKTTAIMHDNQRYDIGSQIELDDTTAESLALYLEPVETTSKGKSDKKEQADNGITEENVALAEQSIADAQKADDKTKGKK